MTPERQDGWRDFRVLQNIPSPYRLHLFAEMHRQLAARGIGFHVHFMSRGHARRPAFWRDPEMGFPHAYWRDWGLHAHGVCCHFNPGLLAALRRRTPAFLLVGSPWDTLTGLLAGGLARRCTSIAWIEGNTRTPGRLDGLIGACKRWALARHRFVAVPGAEGRRYVGLHQARTRRRLPEVVVLPNLVDEGRFRPAADWPGEALAAARQRLAVPPAARLALCPARLEPVKGLCEFFGRVPPETFADWHVRILGEGRLRAALQALLERRGLAANVRLVPYVPYAEMPALYAAANLFVLPSLHDPNPLSVVEAMHSGLPLLLSDRAGNFPEALAEGENGWGFAPLDAAAAARAAGLAFGADEAALRRMGAVSLSLSQAFWNTPAAVGAFLDAVGAR